MSSQLQIDANRRNACAPPAHAPRRQSQSRHNGRPTAFPPATRPPIENPPNSRPPRPPSRHLPARQRGQEFSLREMAWADWRLRRVVRIESGMYAYRLEKIRLGEHCPDTAPNRPAPSGNSATTGNPPPRHRLLSDCEDNAFVKLSRYENALRRAYYKARNELQSSRPALRNTPDQTKFRPGTPRRHRR